MGELPAADQRCSTLLGLTLEKDLRGSWTIHHDPFKAITICRNLLFPGYTFFFNNKQLTWGEAYVGSGLQNRDFIFMV